MPEPEYIKVMIIFIIDEIFISKCERKNKERIHCGYLAAWIFIRDADPHCEWNGDAVMLSWFNSKRMRNVCI